MNRYADLESHRDLGEGADEPEIHRYTRQCERERLAAEVTLRRLDSAAARAWQRMEDTPRDHPQWEMVRDLAFAAKDRADEFARKMKTPSTTNPGQDDVEGNHPKSEKEI